MSYKPSADLVTLGSFFKPEDQIYPAPAASPAPLTTDGGIVSGQPSPTTGLRFISAADLTAFNYQGMWPAGAPAGIVTAAGAGCICNADTPRRYSFGTYSGEWQPGTIDLRFVTDSLRVIPIWYNYSGYSGTAYHDQHMMVSDRGVMKHLSDGSASNGLPRTNAGGTGLYRRELTYDERRPREHRAMFPGFAYFLGVWIDTLATIVKAPNRPLFMHDMDSWNEPLGASWDGTQAGLGFPTGTYMCLGMPQVASFITGCTHGTCAQGGTGEENANGTSGGNLIGYAGSLSSAMWTDSRVNDFLTKFGPQYPIKVDIGGWNDDTSLGTPYRTTYAARVQARYAKTIANSAVVGRDIKMINVGIQPVEYTDGSARDLSQLGQADAAALFPANVLGHVNLKGMWPDRSSSGARSIYCYSQGGIWIHMNLGGNYSVSSYIWSQIAQMKCSRSYIAAALSA